MTEEQIAQQWRELYARHRGEILELGGSLISAKIGEGISYRDALDAVARVKHAEYREK
jgi:hypothetical protein